MSSPTYPPAAPVELGPGRRARLLDALASVARDVPDATVEEIIALLKQRSAAVVVRRPHRKCGGAVRIGEIVEYSANAETRHGAFGLEAVRMAGTEVL